MPADKKPMFRLSRASPAPKEPAPEQAALGAALEGLLTSPEMRAYAEQKLREMEERLKVADLFEQKLSGKASEPQPPFPDLQNLPVDPVEGVDRALRSLGYSLDDPSSPATPKSSETSSTKTYSQKTLMDDLREEIARMEAEPDAQTNLFLKDLKRQLAGYEYRNKQEANPTMYLGGTINMGRNSGKISKPASEPQPPFPDLQNLPMDPAEMMERALISRGYSIDGPSSPTPADHSDKNRTSVDSEEVVLDEARRKATRKDR